MVMNLPSNAGDADLISGSRRSSGEANGNPFQHNLPALGSLQNSVSIKMERAKGEAQRKAPRKVRERGYFSSHCDSCKQYYEGCDI